MEPFLTWKVPRPLQPKPGLRAAIKTKCRLLKPDQNASRFHDMRHVQPTAIRQAERELDETKGLVIQQYRIVKRLKQLGADTKEAILLLLNLLDLEQSRQRRLSYLRMPGPSVSGLTQGNDRGRI
jgi:hypothetical protein